MFIPMAKEISLKDPSGDLSSVVPSVRGRVFLSPSVPAGLINAREMMSCPSLI